MPITFDCTYSYPDGFTLEGAYTAGDGVTGISGPSGSGKTTMLMLIAGLLRPTRGRITINDDVLVDTKKNHWLPPHQRGIGMVFQDSLLLPHRNVRANLTYGQKRKPRRSISFDHVIEVLELSDLLDRHPATLSGGQQRRVAIGRALLSGPRLLIFDEPWVGLEHTLRDRIVEFTKRCLHEWQIPTLIVSHEKQTLNALTQDIVTLGSPQKELR